MLTMPIAVWLAVALGPTRVIVFPSLWLAFVSFLTPLARTYEILLVLHAVAGLCLGVYLPLTISLALRSLKPQFWLLAMAAYSLRVSVGMDVGVGVRGSMSRRSVGAGCIGPPRSSPPSSPS
jgi:DHA2 family multidrug resistance protein